MQTQTRSVDHVQQFCNYIDLRKFHKQTFRNEKLNRHCAHVIRNGEPVTLTPEQREQFIQNICDIPDNPIGLGVFCGMSTYVFVAGLLSLFPFAIASGFSQISKKIACLLYAAGVILLLLVMAGFVGICILITRKNRKRADIFRAKARDKIGCGDYQSYAYRIEEIYRIKSYNEDMYGGYLYFWYRVGNVIFELPNTTFAYHLGNNDETIYREPEKLELHEFNHPVGGYIIGMLIHLDGQERFYGM
ncbi:MAG: hypothetical protein ACI4EQ_03070 [Lachnospiraceae bacterium]